MQMKRVRSLPVTVYLLGFCLIYLSVAIIGNGYMPFTVDDLWFSHNIYLYKTQLPYRDFPPYKTVLGYYVLLWPMLFEQGVVATLTFTKNMIALLNTGLFFLAAVWLTRFFSGKSVGISLVMVLFTETVIFYSTNIRVDFLGYWFSLFSLLFLLEKRFVPAGCLIGLGFLVTQKVAWCIFASNVALIICWVLAERDWQSFIKIIQFNLTMLIVIFFYMVAWSFVSDWNTVMHHVFYDASVLYHLTSYDSTRHFFWSLILLYNPIVFLLLPCTLISIGMTYPTDPTYFIRVFLVSYAFVILACLVPYKQVFSYYMQVTTPIFLVLYAAFMDFLIAIFKKDTSIIVLVNKKIGWLFLFGYAVAFILIEHDFTLPISYSLLLLIPMLILFFALNKRSDQPYSAMFYHIILLTLLLVGGFYAGIFLIGKAIQFDGRYQKANIQFMEHLLQQDDYVAGVEYVYHKTQPIVGMRQLALPALEFLRQPTPALRSVMLPSLYEDPNVTSESIITALTQSKVKFYVNNYRMEYLPSDIKHYLEMNYAHFWGSIYLYAPYIKAGQRMVDVRFDGVYRIITSSHFMTLNGHPYSAGSSVYLKKGSYVSDSGVSYRLQFMPNKLKTPLNPAYQKDEWEKMI